MPDKKKHWAMRLAESLRLSDYPLGAATNQMIVDELDRAVTNGEITHEEYERALKRGAKQAFMDALSVGTGALTSLAVPAYAAQAAKYAQWGDDVARTVNAQRYMSEAKKAAEITRQTADLNNRANQARLATALGRSAYTASAATPLAMTATREPMSASQLRGSVNGNYFDYPNPFPNGYQKMGYIDPLQESTRILARTNGTATSGAPVSAPSASTTTTTQKSVLPASATKGKTVSEIWTSVTGLPWKAAKEMGLTDGSYAQNIEILKGLKSGRINKDYINGLANGEGVITEEANYAPGAYTPTIAVPEARPFGYVPVQAEPRAMEPELRRADLPAGIVYDGVDMTAPTEREANMAAKGGRMIRYVPVW